MMFLTSSAVVFLGIYLFCKKAISKKLQAEYEKHLLKGDKKMAVTTGRLYYNTLHPQKKKAKGVVNINRKILQDFKDFNVLKMF